MVEVIKEINETVNGLVWGIPAMVCILGVGLYLSFRTRFIQFRKFGYTFKVTLGRIFQKKSAADGSVTPFQAVCTALAATVGTENIAGVAGAIALGGPGAVFWMWISSLLGMCTKFSEVTLAVHFREKKQTGRLGRRTDVLYQKWSWTTLEMACRAFLRPWYSDCFRYGQRNAGQHHHYSYRFRSFKLLPDIARLYKNL